MGPLRVQCKTMKKTRFWGALLLGVIAIRVLYSYLTPIQLSETYHLLCAGHPGHFYVDQPGMLVWIMRAFDGVFGSPLLGIRLAAFLCFLITLFFIYRTTKVLTHDRRIGIQAALFFSLIPYHFLNGVGLQVEVPLLMFGSMAVYTYVLLLKTGRPHYLYQTAVIGALGCLTSYTMGLMLLLMGFCILVFRPYRYLLISRHVFGALLIFGVMICPYLWWNAHQGFVGVPFAIKSFGTSALFSEFWSFLGLQLLYVSPVAVIYGYWLSKFGRSSFPPLGFVAGGIFIGVFLLGFKSHLDPQWTALAYIPLSVFLIAGLGEKKSGGLLRSMFLFSGLVLLVAGFSGQAYFLHHSLYRAHDQIEPYLHRMSQSAPTHIFSDSAFGVSALTYFGNRDVFLPKTLFKTPDLYLSEQFALWPSETRIRKGDSVIFFARESMDMTRKLNLFFYDVRIEPALRLVLPESELGRHVFYECKDAIRTVVF